MIRSVAQAALVSPETWAGLPNAAAGRRLAARKEAQAPGLRLELSTLLALAVALWLLERAPKVGSGHPIFHRARMQSHMRELVLRTLEAEDASCCDLVAACACLVSSELTPGPNEQLLARQALEWLLEGEQRPLVRAAAGESLKRLAAREQAPLVVDAAALSVESARDLLGEQVELQLRAWADEVGGDWSHQVRLKRLIPQLRNYLVSLHLAEVDNGTLAQDRYYLLPGGAIHHFWPHELVMPFRVLHHARRPSSLVLELAERLGPRKAAPELLRVREAGGVALSGLGDWVADVELTRDDLVAAERFHPDIGWRKETSS